MGLLLPGRGLPPQEQAWEALISSRGQSRGIGLQGGIRVPPSIKDAGLQASARDRPSTRAPPGVGLWQPRVFAKLATGARIPRGRPQHAAPADPFPTPAAGCAGDQADWKGCGWAPGRTRQVRGACPCIVPATGRRIGSPVPAARPRLVQRAHQSRFTSSPGRK